MLLNNFLPTILNFQIEMRQDQRCYNKRVYESFNLGRLLFLATILVLGGCKGKIL